MIYNVALPAVTDSLVCARIANREFVVVREALETRAFADGEFAPKILWFRLLDIVELAGGRK